MLAKLSLSLAELGSYIFALRFCMFVCLLSHLFQVGRETKSKSDLQCRGFSGKTLDTAPARFLPSQMVSSSSKCYLEVSDGGIQG